MEKELTTLIEEVNLILKANKKEQLVPLKSKLLAFLANTNLYYSPAHKEQAKQSLTKLENHSDSQKSIVSSPDFSWRIVLPITVILFTIIGLIVIFRNRKKKHKFVKKSN